MAAKTRNHKVNAGYRLPADLVKRIRQRALDDDVQPCKVAERWLIQGEQHDPGPNDPGSDSTTAIRP